MDATPTKLAREVKESLARVLAAIQSGTAPDPEDFIQIHGSTAALEEIADQNAAEIFPAPEFDADRKNANQDRHQGKDAWPCPVCGKATNLTSARWVHMRGDGDYWNVNLTDEVTDVDTMGWFPVGPDCAKRFPPAFLSKGQNLTTEPSPS